MDRRQSATTIPYSENINNLEKRSLFLNFYLVLYHKFNDEDNRSYFFVHSLLLSEKTQTISNFSYFSLQAANLWLIMRVSIVLYHVKLVPMVLKNLTLLYVNVFAILKQRLALRAVNSIETRVLVN
jgi:hypothetical protein